MSRSRDEQNTGQDWEGGGAGTGAAPRGRRTDSGSPAARMSSLGQTDAARLGSVPAAEPDLGGREWAGAGLGVCPRHADT